MKDLFRVWLNPQNEAESRALPGLCCFSVSQRRYGSNTSLSIGPLYVIQFEYFNTCNFSIHYSLFIISIFFCNFSGECAATAVFFSCPDAALIPHTTCFAHCPREHLLFCPREDLELRWGSVAVLPPSPLHSAPAPHRPPLRRADLPPMSPSKEHVAVCFSNFPKLLSLWKDTQFRCGPPPRLWGGGGRFAPRRPAGVRCQLNGHEGRQVPTPIPP